MFRKAIVRKPNPSIVDGITSAPQLGKPDYEKALIQHDAYIVALKYCGLEVMDLEVNNRFPDNCFVEDVAVLTKKCAVVTRPGAESRQGEEVEMAEILGSFYSEIDLIQAPGSLEGGDVMMVGDHFYIGLSERTNLAGANQLIDILRKSGYTASHIELKEVLHLKTGLSYLENNILLISGEFIEKTEFSSFKKIIIPEDELYAANCIRVNDYVMIPEGYEKTKSAIESAGLATLTVDTSEFRKIDGGLSCLSLRF